MCYVEGVGGPWQGVLCVRAAEIRSDFLTCQLSACDVKNARGQIGAREVLGPSLHQARQEASGGAANVQDPQRSKLGAKFCADGVIPSAHLANPQPEARVIPLREIEVVRTVTACLVAVTLREQGSIRHTVTPGTRPSVKITMLADRRPVVYDVPSGSFWSHPGPEHHVVATGVRTARRVRAGWGYT